MKACYEAGPTRLCSVLTTDLAGSRLRGDQPSQNASRPVTCAAGARDRPLGGVECAGHIRADQACAFHIRPQQIRAPQPGCSKRCILQLGPVFEDWIRSMDRNSLAPRALAIRSGHRIAGRLAFLRRVTSAASKYPVAFPMTLCDSPSARGGSWSPNGVILFSPNAGPLQRVPDSGGSPVPATTLDKAKGEIYSIRTAKSADDGVYVGSLDRPAERVRLISGSLNASYAPARNGRNGYLLWVRDGRLMAQPLDPVRAKLSGEPTMTADDVRSSTVAYYCGTTLSAEGNGHL